MTREQEIDDQISEIIFNFENDSNHTLKENKYYIGAEVIKNSNNILDHNQNQDHEDDSVQKPNSMRTCSNCGTSSTSTWRNLGENLVCNACKCFYRKHGRSRPVHMRKDAIIPRHRKVCKMSIPNEGVFKIDGKEGIDGMVEPDSCLFAEAVCMLMKYFS